MNNVTVVGSSNIDLITVVPDLPSPGETVMALSFDQKNGGKGANQAVAACKAGAKVEFISAVGNDGYGQELVKYYSALGIDTSKIKSSHQTTGIALINISSTTKENSITVASGANADLLPADVSDISGEIIVLQNEIPLPTIAHVINSYGDRTIIYNPAPYQDAPDLQLNHINILVVNETECKQLCGLAPSADNDHTLLDRMKTLEIPHIIITMGSSGCIYLNISANTVKSLPAFNANVIDTTGAGDTFCGYLAASIDKDAHDHSSSIIEAMAASAIAISAIGAQEAMPTKAEVQRFLNQ